MDHNRFAFVWDLLAPQSGDDADLRLADVGGQLIVVVDHPVVQKLFDPEYDYFATTPPALGARELFPDDLGHRPEGAAFLCFLFFVLEAG